MSAIVWLLDNWRVALFAAVVALLATFYMLWQDTEKDLTVLQVQTESEAKAAKAYVKETHALHTKTLKETNNDWRKRLPEVRSGAVAAYLAAHRVPQGGNNPGDPAAHGPQVPDGAGQECLPDRKLIEDAAEDALKIAEFQDFVRKNKLPVEGEILDK